MLTLLCKFYKQFIHKPYICGSFPQRPELSKWAFSQWSSMAEAAFGESQSHFTCLPILIFQDPTHQFTVEVDIWDIGIGIVISVS